MRTQIAVLLLSAALAVSCSTTIAQRPLLSSAPGSPIAVGDSPGCIATGDVNRDGKLDLVVAGKFGTNVLLGGGDGGFRVPPGGTLREAAPPTEMVLADLNRDGRLDLALANHDSYAAVVAAAGVGVRAMLGDGRGGFRKAPGSPFATGRGAWQLVVGDWNGDGKPDVATSDLESGTVTVLLAS